MKTINTIKIAAIAIMAFVLGTAQNAIAQGDNCGLATPITPGTYTGTTVGASPETQPFCGTGDGTGGGVWYTITGGACGGDYTVSTCINTGYDSKLRVFEGTCGALTCVTGIDDFCGLQSEVTWTYTPGVTYYILVHGFGTSEGAYELNVTDVVSDVTAPAPINGLSSVDQSQLSNTTCMATFNQGDVAQSFIPTQNSMCGAGIEINAASSGDLTLELWDALPNAGGNLIAQGTQTYTSATWIDVFWSAVAVTPGNTYYLVATSTTGGDCWTGNTSNPYPDGNVFANPGYGSFPTYDYVFETHYGCQVVPLADVNASCQVTSLVAPYAQDNCVGAVTGTPDATFPITTTTTVTWTYDDGNGNTSTQTQDVIISDATAPVADVASLTTINEECTSTPVAPTATDNCSGSVTGTPDVTFPITTQGTTTVTWTYDDGNGNTSTQTQDVVIADATAPVADVASLPTINEQCSSTPAAPTATDNCAGAITGVPDVTFPITTTTTVTWTYDDGNGNTSTQTQDVVIADATAPVADVASLPTINEQCSSTPAAPTATDNCAGAITGVPDVTFPITTTTTVTWTYDDGNGNTSTQTQDVVIADATAPVADVASLTTINEECSSTPVAPTATDNCAGAITGTPDVTFPITTQGTTTVTWTYDDGNGNTSTQTQDVVIADATAPVADVASLTTINEECSSTPVAPTATDNCAGAITGTPDVTFPITTQGTTTVTWTYDDGNGNTSTQTQDVVIADATAPVADMASLTDETGACDVTPVAPTATDNCAGTITGTPDVTFPITASGTTTVTWTYDDGNGNTSTQTQDVIVTGVETGVTQSGSTLTADAMGVTYQWLDCNNGYAVISGETNASFTPTATTGNYAVEIDDNGCVDTSACFVVDNAGLSELEALGVSIYPNPSSGQFTIDSKKANLKALKILDTKGRVVYEVSSLTESKVDVNISNESKGVYYIQVSGDFGSVTQKIILD